MIKRLMASDSVKHMSLPDALRFACYACIIGYGFLATWYSPGIIGSLYDEPRFLELAFLISSGLLAVLISRDFLLATLAHPRLSRLSQLSFGLFVAASALQSRFPELAWQEISLFVLLFFFGSICANLAHENKRLTDRLFTASLTAGALIFVVVFAVAYAASVSTNISFSWVTPFVNFANVRFFSQYQAYTLPLLIIPAIAFNLPGRWRVAALLLTSLWWTLHFTSGTRSVWVASVVTALVMTVSLRRTIKPWLNMQGWALSLGGMIYLIFDWWSKDFVRKESYGLPSVLARGTDDDHRFELWRAAWEMIQSSPWLGVGPMHFGFYHFQVAAHPHNVWLQIAAEYGLPVVLIVTYWIARLFLSALRWCRTTVSYEDRQINTALTASLLCGLVDAMFSGNILMPQSQMALFLVGGWLIGRNWRPAAETQPYETKATSHSPLTWGRLNRHWSHAALALVVLASIVIQTKGVLDYYQFMAEHDFALLSDAHPRFWHDGHWPTSSGLYPAKAE